MATASQIRGAMLEEAVLFLLKKLDIKSLKDRTGTDFSI